MPSCTGFVISIAKIILACLFSWYKPLVTPREIVFQEMGRESYEWEGFGWCWDNDLFNDWIFSLRIIIIIIVVAIRRRITCFNEQKEIYSEIYHIVLLLLLIISLCIASRAFWLQPVSHKWRYFESIRGNASRQFGLLL